MPPNTTRRAAPGQESGPATHKMQGSQSHVRCQRTSTRILIFGCSQAEAEAHARNLVRITGLPVTLRKYENGQQVPMTPEAGQ